MKRAIPILTICAASTVLFAVGCSKTDNPPPPEAAKQAPPTQGTLAAPQAPPPRLPDPIVPKGAEAPSPKPGQAGDTSSEAFKGGGSADPHR